MNFIIATGNPGKMEEMRRILARMGHTAQSQREAGITLEPEENGATFAENALIKAKAIAQASGQPTIA
ncbi:MAG: non-canonical purine NTP pyrophosphatase, partial [Ruthenibacterium sp.]